MNNIKGLSNNFTITYLINTKSANLANNPQSLLIESSKIQEVSDACTTLKIFLSQGNQYRDKAEFSWLATVKELLRINGILQSTNKTQW